MKEPEQYDTAPCSECQRPTYPSLGHTVGGPRFFWSDPHTCWDCQVQRGDWDDVFPSLQKESE